MRRLRLLPSLSVRSVVIIAVLFGTLVPSLLGAWLRVRTLYGTELSAEITSDLDRNVEVLATGVGASLHSLNRDVASSYIDALMHDPSIVRIELYDVQNKVFLSREDPTRRIGLIHTASENVVYNGLVVGRAHIEITDSPFVEGLQHRVAVIVGLVAAQAAISVLLILLVLRWRVDRPLRRLVRDTARLARGELEESIQIAYADEIGEVQSQLETTRQALRSTLQSLEQKNRALEVDLTERRHVETVLRDREQRLRALVDQSPLAVIEYDLAWNIRDWNEAAANVFGWSRSDVLGKRAAFMLDARHDADSIFDGILAECAHGSTVARRQVHNIRADGAIVACRWFNSVIRDAAGRPWRIVCIAEDITESLRAEEEIRRLATVVQRTTNLVALVDAQGIIQWHNAAFAQRSGYMPEAIQGQPLVDVLRGTSDYSPFIQLIDAIEHGGVLHSTELPCLDRTGETYWVEAELQPLLDEQGTIAQYIVVLNDVTVRRRIAQALSALASISPGSDPYLFLEQSLHALARGVGAEAAYLAYDGGRGDAWQVIAAWSGSPGWRLPRGVQNVPSRVAEGLKGGALIHLAGAHEVYVDDPVVGALPFLNSIVAVNVPDENVRPVGHLAFLFDAPPDDPMEVRSLAELGAARAGAELVRINILEALRNSEHKFSSIFHHAPIPLFLIRQTDYTYMDVNPSACEVFGVPREELIGQSPISNQIFINAEEQDALRDDLLIRGFASGRAVQVRTRSGAVRDCQLQVRSVVTTEPCWLVAAVDVTPLRAAQRQVEELNASLELRVSERTRDLAATNRELAAALDTLRRAQSELIRSEKLAALGSLVAGVAHELNTPIGNSLMAASTFQELTSEFERKVRTGVKRSELNRYVQEGVSASDILVRNLQRAGQLISSFKQVAVDQTSSQRRKFDLADVVREIVLTTQPVFRGTPYVVESCVPPGIGMDSYPGPLEQVLANLLNNTIMHAFEGQKTGTVKIEAQAKGRTVCIMFSDDGVGIPDAALPKLFDPFFTTKQHRTGTGLGLHIVHNIVTGVLGGRVEVESQEGRGTTFRICLPLVAPVHETVE